MLKIFLPLLLCLILNSIVTNAQQSPIIADRPDQTEAPFIVPRYWLQVETGLLYEKISATSSAAALPTVLTKFGVNERFELRLITEYITQNDVVNQRGLAPITIGFKVKLAEERGIFPHIAFVGHYGTANLGTPSLSTNTASPSFRFLMQHTLSPRISLSYNLGAEWDGASAKPTYIYTLSLGYAATDKLGFYTEFFGYLPEGQQADHRFDAGGTYLLSDNFMLDLSGGVGLTPNSIDGYASLGFSFRVPLCKQKTLGANAAP